MKITIDLGKLAPVLLVAPLALLVTVPHAQKGATKIGIVDSTAVTGAVPGGQAVTDLRKKADADIAAQTKKIQTLQQKASPTAADRQALDTAVKTLQAAQQNYAKQLNTQFKPVADKVNAAVAAAAKAGGFSIVFDAGVAQRSGLIIYANSNATNITQSVLKQVKK